MLNGAHVLVTRPEHQAEKLSGLIEATNGVAIRFPTLEIVPLNHSLQIQNTMAQLESYQWLIFISANAVTMQGYYSDSDKIKNLSSTRIAAIGKATAQALQQRALVVDLVPESGYNSQALLAMADMQVIKGQKCLIIRGENGHEELADTLRTRGATVEYLDVYKRIMPTIDSSQVMIMIEKKKLDVITITSGEALKNLVSMVGKSSHQSLFEIPLVVVSNRIRQIAAEIGFKRIAVTQSPSDNAVLETVIMSVTGGIA